jgi:HAD superfamily hydrolase (TIGR01509 family)
MLDYVVQMQSVSQIRGIIFDLDGVLIRSADSHRAAFEEVLKPFGINDFDYGIYAGWRTRDVIKDALERRGLIVPPGEIADVSARKTQLARKLLEASQPIDPACGHILAELAAQYPLGLASSGSRSSVLGFLEWTGSRTLFRSVFSSEDVAKSKPDPEIYIRCASQMGLEGSQCLVVEDAVAGVVAAKAMGAVVVGLPGTVSEQELRDAGADFAISQLRDLLPLLKLPQSDVEPASWTAIIPAAGRGSRLGFHRPKILYPVGGRMILEWMLDFLEPNYSQMVFVLSPEGSAEVVGELNKLIPGRFEVVIQETPTGMGDAVQLALPHATTPQVTIVWGDQVALRYDSVKLCQRLHQGPLQPDLTCPTVLRKKPYIHFERNGDGKINGIRQAREGDAMPEQGESDTGFFCFKTASLDRVLAQARKSGQTSGTATGEFNLLPVIPVMAQEGVVLTPRVMCLEETMGINASSDAVAVAEFLGGERGR